MVDQKTEEQKKMEAEYKLHKTYDRISLPNVIKRRQMLEVNPHTRVQLSKAQKIMKFKKQASLAKIADIIGDKRVNQLQ